MGESKVKAESASNIAIVKYWGKRGVQIPMNPSISFTLSNAKTITELIAVESEKPTIVVKYGGEEKPSFLPKIKQWIERITPFFPEVSKLDLNIDTNNTFPHGSGIASSASGMSALAMALLEVRKELYQKEYTLQEASNWARLGSGSACRSVIDQWSLWGQTAVYEGSNDEYAVPVTDVELSFNSIKDCILIVDKDEKEVSSTVGHKLMEGHRYAEARFEQARENTQRLLDILKEGDWWSFIELAESEALSLHAVMLTSDPSFILMKPNTLKAIELIKDYRRQSKIPVGFTLDAGANVHVLYPESEMNAVNEFIIDQLKPLCIDQQLIWDEIGLGTKIVK